MPIETKQTISDVSPIFIEIEKFIESKRLCELYQQSDLIELLSGHEENLSTYLENSEILKLIAQKTKTGSILKTKLIHSNENAILELRIYAEDGINLLFHRQQTYQFKNQQLAIETFKNWLIEYGKYLPYHSRIIEKNQDSFLIEKSHFFKPDENYEVFIFRPNKELRGGLYHFDKMIIGKANIEIQANRSGLGKLQSYLSDFKIKAGDWISIEKITKSMKRKDQISLPLRMDIGEQNHLGIGFNLGIGDTEIDQGTSTDEIGGIIYGVNILFQYWISHRFFVAGNFSNTLGSLGVRERSTTTDFYGEPSSIQYELGVKLPQFTFLKKNQFLFSIARSKTSYHHRLSEKFTPFNISSLLFKTEWRYPLKDRNFLSISYSKSLSSNYKEKNVLNGEADSASQSIYKLSMFFLPLGQNRYHSIFLEMNNKKAEFDSALFNLTATESRIGYQIYFNF